MPHSDAYLIPQNIIIFVSIAIGACFVGTVAMAFLVFSRNIQYRSLSDRLRKRAAGTSASDPTGTGSNRRLDEISDEEEYGTSLGLDEEEDIADNKGVQMTNIAASKILTADSREIAFDIGDNEC